MRSGGAAGRLRFEPQSPYYGDERFLVLGVRPDAEADAVAEELERSGFKVTSKLNGLHFTALGATDADGAPVKVRIVTARASRWRSTPVVATPLRPGIRYALMPPPVKDTHDADGDGFEEVFVHRLTDGVVPLHPRLPRARFGLRGPRAERAVRARRSRPGRHRGTLRCTARRCPHRPAAAARRPPRPRPHRPDLL